ncbi:hypothetical protein ABZX95_42325 [Streptomyces sp. NPDC004232]|uniref:hypothetical protein n=1 Tax=Streptomyces sp. NPDC004232 TaxID=3154454 RepID=UPI00339FF02E
MHEFPPSVLNGPATPYGDWLLVFDNADDKKEDFEGLKSACVQPHTDTDAAP